MKTQKGFIHNIILITIVLGMAILSQQAFFQPTAKVVVDSVSQIVSNPLNSLKNTISSRVSGEVAKREVIVKEEVEKQKNNFLQMLWENTKKYIAEKFSSITGQKVE